MKTPATGQSNSDPVYHGNVSVQKLLQICTLDTVKIGRYGVGIKLIKRDTFHYFSMKSYVLAL